MTPAHKLESSEEFIASTIKPESVDNDIEKENPIPKLVVTEKKREDAIEIEDNSDVYSGFSDVDDGNKNQK